MYFFSLHYTMYTPTGPIGMQLRGEWGMGLLPSDTLWASVQPRSCHLSPALPAPHSAPRSVLDCHPLASKPSLPWLNHCTRNSIKSNKTPKQTKKRCNNNWGLCRLFITLTCWYVENDIQNTLDSTPVNHCRRAVNKLVSKLFRI